MKKTRTPVAIGQIRRDPDRRSTRTVTVLEFTETRARIQASPGTPKVWIRLATIETWALIDPPVRAS